MPDTGRQIQIMVAVVFVAVVLMIGYSIWDTSRADEAADDRLSTLGERGAELFAVNCRRCHGLEGLGTLENPEAFPGAPLNVDQLRLTDENELEALQARLFSTIECGRVGTLMPAWSIDENGNLTDQQITELVVFITQNPDNAWEHVVEYGLEHDPIGASPAVGDTSFVTLAEAVPAEPDESMGEFQLTRGWQLEGDPADLALVQPGTRIRLDEEFVLLVDEEGLERLLNPPPPEEEEEDDESGEGDDDGAEPGEEGEPTPTATPGGPPGVDENGEEEEETEPLNPEDLILVRGYQGTEIAEHAAGSTVFGTPPEAGDDITGAEGTPPCGQNAPAGAGDDDEGEAAEVSENGEFTIVAGDNFFEQTRVEVSAGQELTATLDNQGTAAHNLTFFQGETDDAEQLAATEPTVSGGEQETITFTAPGEPGDYLYQCTLHPTQMVGTLVVE